MEAMSNNCIAYASAVFLLISLTFGIGIIKTKDDVHASAWAWFFLLIGACLLGYVLLQG